VSSTGRSVQTQTPGSFAAAPSLPKVDGVTFSTEKIKFGPMVSGSSASTPAINTPSNGVQTPRLFPNLKFTTPKPPPQQPETELPEIESDTEDESDGNILASWANTPELRHALARQQVIDPEGIFGPIAPLQFDEVFKISTRLSRFRPRSSSANWSGQDQLTKEERDNYARNMGYKK
jgi:hypothetical protein